MSALLEIRGLRCEIESSATEILHGVDLEVGAGSVVAIMGPNGSGKSTLGHVLMGRPGYRVTSGEVVFDGVDLLTMTTWERARAGLYLAHQYPVEVPGVPLGRALAGAVAGRAGRVGHLGPVIEAEASRLGLDGRFATWPLNVDLSGGEKKRNETLQLAVLRPRVAVLDEIDSGLDVDALSTVANRIAEGVTAWGMGVLAITHYSRLLEHIAPDRVHVMAHGHIVDSGGPELARSLEETGYAGYD